MDGRRGKGINKAVKIQTPFPPEVTEEHNEEAGVSPEVRKRSIWSRDSLQKTVARRLFRSCDSRFFVDERLGGGAIFVSEALHNVSGERLLFQILRKEKF